ncbi:lipopolysaccharide assembly protein LapA domain-containing protein [Corynebacterium glyciniphilum]|uniref:lipopolysaccharide assembly protein LapA domain-containing protein n=1 Tax=Corynebacterium glyciniphilum TaxID=1404244 RepID=UPI0016430122|nr:lipopolysaccharide assembly protein LapA domain-containing protein [Corynebacterium glyciniphilum]
MRTDNTASDTTKRQRSSVGLVVTTAIVVIVAIALIILIGQNTDQVDMGFLGWEFAFPLSVGLVAAAIGGAIVAFALSGIVAIRRRK